MITSVILIILYLYHSFTKIYSIISFKSFVNVPLNKYFNNNPNYDSIKLFIAAESKNSSESHLTTSADVLPPESYPPFSSLMLVHVKGHKRFSRCFLVIATCSGFFVRLNDWCLW